MIVRKICFLRSALNILALGALAACLSVIAFSQNSQDTPPPGSENPMSLPPRTVPPPLRAAARAGRPTINRRGVDQGGPKFGGAR
jgi:hypothetical protein